MEGKQIECFPPRYFKNDLTSALTEIHELTIGIACCLLTYFLNNGLIVNQAMAGKNTMGTASPGNSSG